MGIEQGSEAWHLARLGHATGSCFSDVLAKGEGKTRLAYMQKVVAERLTGKPTEGFSSHHTERGHEQEPFAKMSYEAVTGNMIEDVGFIRHETLMAGSSPDGLVGADGGVEVKSVIPTVQIETIRKGKYPTSHRAQVQGNLWICKREWWDFVSFSPDLPKNLRLYVYRVERDEEYIKNLEVEVTRFLDEAEELYQKLLRMN